MADRTRRESVRPGDDRGKTLRESESLDATRSEQGADAASGFSGLPSPLVDRYRVIRRLASGGQGDIFLAEGDASRKVVIKLYRHAEFAVRGEILKRLGEVAKAHVAAVLEHGTYGDRPFEVLEYVEHGSLEGLIGREGPRLAPDRVREVVKELAEALAAIHAAKVEHRDLKPGNVLIRSIHPLDLVLVDFGISKTATDSIWMSSVGGATYAYAPPEVIAQIYVGTGADRRRVAQFHRGKWDCWSLGMMVVEMLTGQHPFSGCNDATIGVRLGTMDVDDLVEEVSDPAWKKLCRGLLRRDPRHRWGIAEVSRWLRNPNDPSLVVVGEQAPGTRRTIRFAGKDYVTKEELAAAMAADWKDACDYWKRRAQELIGWLKHDLGETAIGEALERIDKDPRLDLDGQVLAVITALDPDRPPSFRGFALNPANLAVVADRAGNDPTAAAILRKLHESRILQILGARSQLSRIGQGWEQAVAEYRQLSERVNRNASPVPDIPELAEKWLSILLAAATPGSKVLEKLRNSAVKASSERARKCSWFRELGNPRHASPASALLMRSLAPAAEKQAAEEEKRQQYEYAVNVYGRVAGVLFGGLLGALGGLGVNVIPLGIVWLVLSFAGVNVDGFIKILVVVGTIIGIIWGARDPQEVVGASEYDAAKFRQNALRIIAGTLAFPVIVLFLSYFVAPGFVMIFHIAGIMVVFAAIGRFKYILD